MIVIFTFYQCHDGLIMNFLCLFQKSAFSHIVTSTLQETIWVSTYYEKYCLMEQKTKLRCICIFVAESLNRNNQCCHMIWKGSSCVPAILFSIQSHTLGKGTHSCNCECTHIFFNFIIGTWLQGPLGPGQWFWGGRLAQGSCAKSLTISTCDLECHTCQVVWLN